MNTVLNVVLTHQSAPQVANMLKWWRQVCSNQDLLIAFGGSEDTFNQIQFDQKLLIADERLRTRDHPRDLQSYSGIFTQVSDWLAERNQTHIYFAEYDHIPLVADLNARQIAFLEREDADVVGHLAIRVDGTNHPHYLYHISDDRCLPYWKSITKRRDPDVILWMIGTGSVWTREAFLTVAAADEPFRMYLEIRLPTLAHHLGFRVRDYGDQNRHVRALGDFESRINEARNAGAWTIHPVKALWNRDLSTENSAGRFPNPSTATGGRAQKA